MDYDEAIRLDPKARSRFSIGARLGPPRETGTECSPTPKQRSVSIRERVGFSIGARFGASRETGTERSWTVTRRSVSIPRSPWRSTMVGSREEHG